MDYMTGILRGKLHRLVERSARAVPVIALVVVVADIRIGIYIPVLLILLVHCGNLIVLALSALESLLKRLVAYRIAERTESAIDHNPQTKPL